jgi:hypothetical protein
MKMSEAKVNTFCSSCGTHIVVNANFDQARISMVAFCDNNCLHNFISEKKSK